MISCRKVENGFYLKETGLLGKEYISEKPFQFLKEYFKDFIIFEKISLLPICDTFSIDKVSEGVYICVINFGYGEITHKGTLKEIFEKLTEKN